MTAVAAVTAVGSLTATAGASPDKHGRGLPAVIGHYKHLVVIYEENHSFDNLYGTWGLVDGQQVDGLSSADQVHTTQVAQNGDAYGCLLQTDVNLTSPSPLATTCVDSAHGVAASHFTNDPFTIDDYIGPTDRTCPPPGVYAPTGVLKDSPGALPGGCTRDLVHRFYQEQYQLNGGQQNRYVTGSDAAGLTMGQYDTKSLPIYEYLHGKHAPNYVIADHFFQSAFGGSFLNHQWLVAARAPIDTTAGSGGAHAGLHSVVDSNGFPNASYPLYHPATTVKDAQLTQACGPDANANVACGDYAVNTMQPSNPPFGNGAKLPLIDDTQYPNIGDELSAQNVSWNWYSGGWNDAAAGHPGPLFQFHHQPLNYFANYAPGQPGRTHLKDETDFIASATKGTLPTVSFVKPYGAENEHPGYASEPNGSDHLVDLLRTILSGPQARDTLVVVTYDEFGGQWDHVPPPGQGGSTAGVHDQWGPGTRIPALILSRSMKRSGVDPTVYDTTSILATIEHGLGLAPLSTRDAAVADLSNALRVGRDD
ncbi:MAG: alkaline phosphatase family protein [Actinomycetota bacterium]